MHGTIRSSSVGDYRIRLMHKSKSAGSGYRAQATEDGVAVATVEWGACPSPKEIIDALIAKLETGL